MNTDQDQVLPTGRMRRVWQRHAKKIYLAAGCVLLLLIGALAWLMHDLPSLAELDNVQPKVPLRVYAEGGELIGEFGKERRSLVKLANMPAHLKQAVLDIEDARFYEHGAIDVQGVLRAGLANLGSGGRGQGASTITMQLARDLFLSKDKTFTRKLREIIVAYKIEAVRSKDEVLELYMNQVYLGQRAYGFASAARVYFGKEVQQLTLAEAAMLAGLPKAPAAYNPVVNPQRARIRQHYILKRMRELGHIDEAAYQQALYEPLQLAQGQAATPSALPKAEYAAEMVRQELVAQYGDKAYGMGLVVKTTLNYPAQLLAWDAVRASLLEYDRKRPYRGPEGMVNLPAEEEQQEAAVAEALENYPDAEGMPAVVVLSTQRGVKAMQRDGVVLQINGDGLRYIGNALRSSDPAVRIRPGSIIRYSRNAQGKPEISQLPEVQGALIALAPQDGGVKAVIGGFDFKVNAFNRVAQASRQPGSTFKPFVYSAALEKGVGPASLVNDAPMSVQLDPGAEPWEPKNDDGSYVGPISLRKGLQKSKNMVALKVLEHIGVPYARQFVGKFGFEPKQVPAYLPMALGAGQVTPLQLAGGYAVFANGGYRVKPYLISEVRDGQGKLLFSANAPIAGRGAPQVISPQNAFVMDRLLHGVAQNGTAYESNRLGRTDLAGKTGTTNDARDAWFAGYQHSLLAISWMGFDQPRSLGSPAAGGQLALPLWMRFMGKALQDVPQYKAEPPPGVSQIGGEWYLDAFKPGQGFVARIGVDGGWQPAPEEDEPPVEEEVPADSEVPVDVAPEPSPAPAAG